LVRQINWSRFTGIHTSILDVCQVIYSCNTFFGDTFLQNYDILIILNTYKKQFNI
jgi:hypothetical protein